MTASALRFELLVDPETRLD